MKQILIKVLIVLLLSILLSESHFTVLAQEINNLNGAESIKKDIYIKKDNEWLYAGGHRAKPTNQVIN